MRLRGFEIVSKYLTDNNVKSPLRATKLSAGYDLFNNTGSEIVIEPGELSEAITTKVKAYMQPGEFLAIYPRSGHGFKYSVRLANSVGIIDCVPGDTLISTPIGEYSVLDILDKNIKNIYSYNEEKNEIEEDLLNEIVEVDGHNMVELELINGDMVKIPSTKKVYTKRGWVAVKELTIDDEILTII
jgi:hypothetical protein